MRIGRERVLAATGYANRQLSFGGKSNTIRKYGNVQTVLVGRDFLR